MKPMKITLALTISVGLWITAVRVLRYYLIDGFQ